MSDTKPIRVMIVDDYMMVRDGLKAFLSFYDDLEVVAEAKDGEQAVALCTQVEPDVILMDIVMPGMDGASATQQILQKSPQVHVIALTSFIEEELVQGAMQAGAIGYLLKDVNANQLAQAIRAAYRGYGTIDSAAVQVLAKGSQVKKDLMFDLTPRERDVLELMASGKSNKQIAEDLTLSTGTVRFHISNILTKMGVDNRTEAVILAFQSNIV